MTEQLSAPDADAASGAPAPAAAPRRSPARLLRASAVMASGSIVSRMLGFIRNFLLGVVVAGTGSAVSSSVSAANILPNTIWIFIGGGVLNAILVPAIVKASTREDRGADYISRLMTLVLLCSAVLTVICIAAVPLLVTLTSGRLTGSTLSLAIMLGYWLMPQIMFSALYVMCGQLLNAHESFGPFQWAPVLNNVVAIIGSVVFLFVWGHTPEGASGWTLPTGSAKPTDWTMPMIIAFAAYNVAGSAAQVLFLWRYVRRLGLHLRPRWGFRGLGLGTLSRIGLWTLAMLGVAQVGVWATRWATGGAQAMAAHYTKAHDAVTASQYPSLYAIDSSYMAFMIPQGIIAVALVTAAFPSIARNASAQRHSEVLRQYGRTARLLAVPMVLASVVFIALAGPIMWVIVGNTTPVAARANGLVLAGYMVGLVPFAATYLVKRVFYAYEDARAPFWMQLPNTLISVAAVWPILHLVDPKWATATAALVSSVGNLLGWMLGLLFLHRHLSHRVIDMSDSRATAVTYLKLSAAGAVSLVIGLGMVFWFDDLLWSGRGATVALGVVIGVVMAVMFGLVAWILRVREIDEITSMLTSRIRRRL